MSNTFISERNNNYDSYYGEIDSKSTIGELFNRYALLGRQMGKTTNMLKILKADQKYILVLHNVHMLNRIFDILSREYEIPDKDILKLKNNIILFIPYRYGKGFYDSKVQFEYEKIQKVNPDHKVLIDNAVIDIETQNVMDYILELTKNK